MRALALLVAAMFAVACSSKAGPSEETPYCDQELSEISGALEATLAAPPDVRGEAFAAATTRFTEATMCGPDIAQLVRDWRDHFKTRGGDDTQRALLVRFGDQARFVASSKWRMPAKLSTQIEHARVQNR